MWIHHCGMWRGNIHPRPRRRLKSAGYFKIFDCSSSMGALTASVQYKKKTNKKTSGQQTVSRPAINGVIYQRASVSCNAGILRAAPWESRPGGSSSATGMAGVVGTNKQTNKQTSGPGAFGRGGRAGGRANIFFTQFPHFCYTQHFCHTVGASGTLDEISNEPRGPRPSPHRSLDLKRIKLREPAPSHHLETVSHGPYQADRT